MGVEMEQKAKTKNTAQNRFAGKIGWLIGGVVLGIVVFGVSMFMVMPKMMLTVHQSRYDTVEKTCEELTKAISEEGWNSPRVRKTTESIAKHGENLSREVRIVELCNEDYAKRVLTDNPEVSTLMPCAWGVYEGDDGNVYISGMNMGLMGKMFGGTIAEVMGGHVAEDEQEMLSGVIAE